MEIHETWRFIHGEHWAITVTYYRSQVPAADAQSSLSGKNLVILAELFHYRVMACWIALYQL